MNFWKPTKVKEPNAKRNMARQYILAFDLISSKVCRPLLNPNITEFMIIAKQGEIAPRGIDMIKPMYINTFG